MDETDKKIYINEIYSKQKQIDFLSRINKKHPEPSLEKAIDTLRNSQDKLYAALSYHGVTAAEVHNVIIENSDKAIVAEIMRLQANKNKINKQLENPTLTAEKRQRLENSLANATQTHADAWDNVINSPDKDRIIDQIERAQIKALEREQARERNKDREPSRSR